MFKKLLVFLALALIATPSFASVGIRLNGAMIGTATDLNINCGSGSLTNLSSDGAIYNVNCSPNLATSGFANAGYVSLASTGATISPTYSYVWKVLDTDQNTTYTAGTLANGIPGQILTITAIGYTPDGSGTNASYTLSFTTSLTLKSIVMTKKKDSVTLVYLDDTNGWVLISSATPNSGLTITYRAS